MKTDAGRSSAGQRSSGARRIALSGTCSRRKRTPAMTPDGGAPTTGNDASGLKPSSASSSKPRFARFKPRRLLRSASVPSWPCSPITSPRPKWRSADDWVIAARKAPRVLIPCGQDMRYRGSFGCCGIIAGLGMAVFLVPHGSSCSFYQEPCGNLAGSLRDFWAVETVGHVAALPFPYQDAQFQQAFQVK